MPCDWSKSFREAVSHCCLLSTLPGSTLGTLQCPAAHRSQFCALNNSCTLEQRQRPGLSTGYWLTIANGGTQAHAHALRTPCAAVSLSLPPAGRPHIHVHAHAALPPLPAPSACSQEGGKAATAHRHGGDLHSHSHSRLDSSARCSGKICVVRPSACERGRFLLPALPHRVHKRA